MIRLAILGLAGVFVAVAVLTVIPTVALPDGLRIIGALAFGLVGPLLLGAAVWFQVRRWPRNAIGRMAGPFIVTAVAQGLIVGIVYYGFHKTSRDASAALFKAMPMSRARSAPPHIHSPTPAQARTATKTWARIGDGRVWLDVRPVAADRISGESLSWARARSKQSHSRILLRGPDGIAKYQLGLDGKVLRVVGRMRRGATSVAMDVRGLLKFADLKVGKARSDATVYARFSSDGKVASLTTLVGSKSGVIIGGGKKRMMVAGVPASRVVDAGTIVAEKSRAIFLAKIDERGRVKWSRGYGKRSPGLSLLSGKRDAGDIVLLASFRKKFAIADRAVQVKNHGVLLLRMREDGAPQTLRVIADDVRNPAQIRVEQDGRGGQFVLWATSKKDAQSHVLARISSDGQVSWKRPLTLDEPHDLGRGRGGDVWVAGRHRRVIQADRLELTSRKRKQGWGGYLLGVSRAGVPHTLHEIGGRDAPSSVDGVARVGDAMIATGTTHRPLPVLGAVVTSTVYAIKRGVTFEVQVPLTAARAFSKIEK